MLVNSFNVIRLKSRLHKCTLSLTLSSVPDCAGAIVTATPSGGSAPYTFIFNGTPQPSNTFVFTTLGTYTIFVVDASGCTAFAQITFTTESEIHPILSITSFSHTDTTD